MTKRVFFLILFSMLSFMPITANAGALGIYKNWADVKYGTLNDDQKKSELIKQGMALEALIAKEPKNLEAKVVLGTVKSTHASLIGGLSALPHVKGAKELFEEVIKADGTVMDGQAHAILGALYYGVPGWPIAFGNDDKAEMHIKKALKIAPNSIDANFFMGDYWFENSKYDKAIAAFKKTQGLKVRTAHAAYKAADEGRLTEVAERLKAAEAKLKQRTSRGGGSSLND